ncbi:hypothetical protein BC827DRAFT_1221141 [Russula dissimulans]|nr:hypothetical protein BC827DRAFT_1221141 [Russula dissimulans]
MRLPPPVLRTPSLRSYQSRRKLGCLFSLIIIVSITCLALPLFLPSHESVANVNPLRETLHWQGIPLDDNCITTKVSSPSSKSFAWKPGERYLAYLPHSGFHNQRIALENALVLARILNRTLLVPPARLGNDLVSYHKFDELYQLLIHSGKRGLHHCTRVAPRIAPPSECWGYFDFTHVSWDWLVDLSTVAAEQPLFHHESLAYPWLESPPPNSDRLVVRDQTAYDFRFVDYTPELDGRVHPRYLHPYPISRLAASNVQLIQLGTLFGSARLHLKEDGNLAGRTAIRKSMVFANTHLRTASVAAVNALGGQDTFLAAHVRLSNGPFRTLQERTVRSAWYRLVACALRSANGSLERAEMYELERRLVPSQAMLPPPHGETLVDSVPPVVLPLKGGMAGSLSIRCAGKLHEWPSLAPLNVPLFVATDVEDGLALGPLRATFPCTISMRDVADLPEVRRLNRLVNAEDEVAFGSFLMPLLEASIVARAWAVVGTEGSTFSTYVEDMLWRREHGYEIVQRG